MRATSLLLDEVARQFEEIALRHAARHGFRTYDLLHVASALALKCGTFWSFDKRASKLAKLEGLAIFRRNRCSRDAPTSALPRSSRAA